MDDDESMLEAIRYMVGLMGYSVICANEGRKAVELFNELNGTKALRAMLLDIVVPGGFGGIEAVAEIRKLNPDIPVFAMSGYNDHGALTNPSEYGFTAGLSKPFTMKQLETLLKSAG